MTSLLINSVDRFLRTGNIIGPQSTISGDFGSGQNEPNLFFVDATRGSDTNDGRDPRAPMASIQAALDNCTSGRGDVVIVEAGTYEENVVLSKDYVHLFAAVEGGYGRPDITPASGLAFNCTGQGCVIRGMRFVASDTDAVLHQSNGCKYFDCVIDGDSGQAATDAGLRMKGVEDDDSYTASENLFEDILIRGSDGYGIALDVGDGAGNQVGSTHNVFRRVRLQANVAEDVMAVDTSGGPGAHAVQDTLFDECYFMSRNKATHIDLDTNLGAANTGNMFTRCFIFDDTVDTTAIKVATANAGVVGCFGLDGVIDGDALD